MSILEKRKKKAGKDGWRQRRGVAIFWYTFLEDETVDSCAYPPLAMIRWVPGTTRKARSPVRSGGCGQGWIWAQGHGASRGPKNLLYPCNYSWPIKNLSQGVLVLSQPKFFCSPLAARSPAACLPARCSPFSLVPDCSSCFPTANPKP